MNIYSIIVTLSVILLLYFLKKPLYKINEISRWKLIFYVLISSILGAKLFHLLESINLYFLNPNLIEFSKGFSILGAITAGYLVILLFENKNKINLEELKISLFLYLPLVQATGRIGNISNNELLPYSYYEIFLNLINFIILKSLKQNHEKLIPYLFFINYGLIRILIESLKGNFEFLFYVSILFFIYGFLKVFKLIYKV